MTKGEKAKETGEGRKGRTYLGVSLVVAHLIDGALLALPLDLYPAIWECVERGMCKEVSEGETDMQQE